MTTKFFTALVAAICLAWPGDLHAQRKPLTVEPLTSIAHEPTANRLRFDPVTQAYRDYAVEGTIELVPSSGNFQLSWNGVDGSRQELTWEPPNKVSAIVAAEVSFDEANGLYTYSYTLTNLSSSAQKLNTFYVEAADVESAVAPDRGWYSRALTQYMMRELSIAGWAWSQVRGTVGIPPGQSVAGFRITSRRSPAVVKSYVEGHTPPLRVKEDLPEELHAAIDRVYFRLPAGSTIGPGPEAVAGSAATQAAELLSLAEQAAREGWLGPAASANRMRASLAGIRSSVSRGDDGARATEQIATLLRELRAPDNALLSEGRSLLELRLRLLRDELRQ